MKGRGRTALFVFGFILGFFVGALTAVWWCSRVFWQSIGLLRMGELYRWVQYADKAYYEGSRREGVRALEELLSVMDELEGAEQERIMAYYRLLAHGRLAKLYLEGGDEGMASKHAEHALKLTWALPESDGVTNRDALLKLIGMLDDAEQRKQHAAQEPEDSSSGQCRQGELPGNRRDPGF